MSAIIVILYLIFSVIISGWTFTLDTENPDPVLGKTATKIIRVILMFLFWPIIFSIIIFQIIREDKKTKA